MADPSQFPKAMGEAPSRRPNMGEQKLTDSNVPSLAPDNACDEPAPTAPGGAGHAAIAKDSEGKNFDKVYGVRPKTTWQLKPPATWTLWEFIASLDLCPEVSYQRRAATEKLRGPPPYQPMWRENAFIIPTASIPLAIHWAWNKLVPEHKLHFAPGWVLYHLSFILFAFLMIGRLHKYMATYGTFDELNRGRDMVDDRHVNHLGRSIFIYTVFRTLGPFILSWRGEMSNPFEGLSIYSIPKIMAFEVALDYWFYLYHRSCHEFDSLWFIHRQHHATKHPTPILSILADDIQECIEIFIVPFLASLVTPKMSFVEIHYAICYLLYVEALGHSGIRAYWPHPLLGLMLRPLGMELAVEDHDLHHRFGKSGKNYGKQTRIWDRIFGTVGERIECAAQY
ncbi:hypothetical protein IE81DRAFT_323063 [Ceraceosorus guamensis]|uniref:Fatty acid hydroxylase domain-containing protein n=1 Tax=Ceraceosorus guamensis TaxID=1522189 RepID=A0A316W2D1_9BASI|nr:hypothetical protein IE81DRAFT_323063 [Ceraceosorus guamensis]PWN42721.1 hypothetical protein IE81DRAFT_323063 [Ceraceosorus guamensis]